jgi:hypothetical protein
MVMAKAAGTSDASARRRRTLAPAHQPVGTKASATAAVAHIASEGGMAPMPARATARNAKAAGEANAVTLTWPPVPRVVDSLTSLGVYRASPRPITTSKGIRVKSRMDQLSTP